jgi:hypothetical protein
MAMGVLLSEDDPRGAMHAFLDAAETAAQAGTRPLRWLNLANAAEAAADVGEWDVADRALAETRELPATAHEDGPLFTRAMLAAMRGEPDTARELFDSLGPVQERWGSVQMRTWHLRSRGVVHLTGGSTADALADGLAATRLEPSGGNAANSAWIAIQAAAAERDRAAIDEVLRLTGALRGRWFGAVRLTGRAAVAALDGDSDAEPAGLAALDEWVRLELPLDQALATIALAWVLPADLMPQAHLTRARAALESLGAAGLLRRLDATESSRGPTRS